MVQSTPGNNVTSAVLPNAGNVIGYGPATSVISGSARYVLAWHEIIPCLASSSSVPSSSSSNEMSLARASLFNAVRAARSTSAHVPVLVRGFASTAVRAQAEPVQKQPLIKEFKIYRWVCSSPLFKGAAEADGNSIVGSGGPSKEADSSVVQSRSEPVRANGALLACLTLLG